MTGPRSMRSSRHKITRQIWRLRLVSLSVLIGVCASIFPLPIGWQSRTEKDRSVPFPCQNRPCGCKSAEQCWKKCCCFTNSQKLAWAEENRVRAPSYVSAAAEKERPRQSCQRGTCCARQATEKGPTARGHNVNTSTRTCCTSMDFSAVDKKKTAKVENAVPETTLVWGVYWNQCQGHSWYWNSLPWGVVAEHTDLIIRTPATGYFVYPLSPGLPQASLQPPVPPPRCSVSGSIHS